MKKSLIAFYLLMVFSPIYSANAQEHFFRKIDLPDSAKSILNRSFVKWDYLKSFVPSFDSTSGIRKCWDYADVIKGDFNGDGIVDYAVLVRSLDSLSKYQGHLIVLFGTDDTFTMSILSSGNFNDDNVIFLCKKGTIIEDFDTGDKTELKVDGIDSAIYEKTSCAYYFKEGQFHIIHTND